MKKVPDKPGMAAKIFTALSDAKIVVDVIVQNVSKKGQDGYYLYRCKSRCQEGI